MLIDAQDHTANVIISRLRAEARRTREPRMVTVLSQSVKIAACAIAWAHVMGYNADPLEGDTSSFQVLFTPRV
ncbi:MAG: hypothetical protein AAF602_31490, partial [Myxococcota bacterium]